MTLRALSVKQPWSMAICHGKDVENRSRPTRYRGLIAVHASKAFDDVSPATLDWIAEMTGLTPRQAAQQDVRGAVVAVAEIVGCHEDGDPDVPCGGYDDQVIPYGLGATNLCSPWAVAGQWHWQLANVRPLAEPVPCKGALGLWRLPAEVDEAVRAQLVARSINTPTETTHG
ncbi:hypothetical protein GCM10023085_45930 [Actinomadura viridis]|uniref:ASCH domain-containing protein n=1 Tax=Actinomadura viridis TaxID=58110 RepID=A0A931DJY0_9ACTN|nr:hypothetical protein [Actinomadura viridis]MBG6089953.1 hypothetical protein [Actinomadura viridis]